MWRATSGCASLPRKLTMSHEIIRHLKELKLHGMAQSWPEMVGQTRLAEFDLVSFMTQLLRSKSAEREVRSIAYQMTAARFPAHRDLQGFDFAESKVDESLVRQLHTLSFLDAAHNLVFIGGPGTGKSHLATALGVEAIGKHGKRMRFNSTIELVNALELKKAAGKHGADCASAHVCRPGDSRRTGLFAVQSGRRCAAVPLAVEAVRAHQRGNYHQPWLCRTAVGLRRRQDDHSAARPPDPSLPHRRNR